jgi:hypothetical protein
MRNSIAYHSIVDFVFYTFSLIWVQSDLILCLSIFNLTLYCAQRTVIIIILIIVFM